MNNIMAIYTVLPLLVMTIAIMIMTYLTQKDDKAGRYFLLLCAVVVAWHLVQIAYITNSDVGFSRTIFQAQMLFIPFTPVALLLFVFAFYGMDKYLKPIPVLLICIIPV
ncbi:MAG: hypothetical protein LBU94_05240, partial [Clostridiales bacterium]|nr:hypothetical protein [Clostridiales bacterium]